MTHTIDTRRTGHARRLATLGPVLGAMLLGACATTADLGEDDPLVDAVYQAIRLDPKLESSQVTVTHDGGGVVQLNGFVENITDKQSIVDAARNVDGVTRVDDNTTFTAGG